jgi:hypothetical protein
MKHSFIAALLFVLCFAGSVQKASASHTMGAEISYKCTPTPGIIEITLVYYKLCEFSYNICPTTCGAPCTKTMPIMGADPSCSTQSFGIVSLTLQNIRDVNQNPTCPNAKNLCNNMGCSVPGTYTPAVERYEFSGYANIGPTSGIPSSCCNIRFEFSECCRLGSINTGSANYNFYVDATINRCIATSPCNSSPVFTNDPFIAVCGGQQILYSNNVLDPDEDSLSFAFAPALDNFNIAVPYSYPFAYDRPMPWTGNWNDPAPQGIHCDPLSGDISFTPINSSGFNFNGVIVIEVKQWKTISGIPTVVGKTRRDIHSIILANCPPNNAPLLSTDPPSSLDSLRPQYDWNACASQQLCFNITATDIPALSSDTTFLKATSIPAGATFTPNYIDSNRFKPAPLGGPREDLYRFCWTPHDSAARNAPYFFTVSARDNQCPNPGKVSKTFSIKVKGSGNVALQKQHTGCGNWNIGYTSNLANPLSTWRIASQPGDDSLTQAPYVFSNLKTLPAIRFTKAGKYLVRLEVTDTAAGAGCTRSYTDTIHVDSIMNINTSDTSVCYGSSVTLSATTSGNQAPYTFKWYNSIRDTASLPLNAPVYTTPNWTATPTSARSYTIVVTDKNGCRRVDSVHVSVGPDVNTPVIRSIQCHGMLTGSITITPRINAGYRYKLNNDAEQDSGSFINLAAGIYTLTVSDSNGCSRIFNNLAVTEPAPLRDSITTIQHEVCYNTRNGSLTTLAAGGTAPYQYKLSSTGAYGSSRTFTPLIPGSYTLFIKDSKGCEFSAPHTINSADSLSYHLSYKAPSCFGSSDGAIKINASGGTPPYLYNIKNGSFDTTSTFNNLEAGIHRIVIKDNQNCQHIVNQRIQAPAALTYGFTRQHVTCFGDSNGMITLNASGGTPPYVYKINNGAFDTTAAKTGLSAGTHTFSIRDSAGCLLNFTQAILQPQVLTTTSTQKDISCAGRTDGSIIVTPSGGTPPYRYSIGSGAPVISPVFSNLGEGSYSIKITDDEHCSDSLSLTLIAPRVIKAGAISGRISVQQHSAYQYTTPAQTGVTYSWSADKGTVISGQSTSTVDIRWDSTGAGMVYAALKTDSACGDTASLTVTIGSTGMEEYARTIGLDVFPNPVKDLLHITVQRLPEATLIKLYDAQGKILVQQPLQQQQQIRTDHLAPGVYLLQMGSWRGQIIKQ